MKKVKIVSLYEGQEPIECVPDKVVLYESGDIERVIHQGQKYKDDMYSLTFVKVQSNKLGIGTCSKCIYNGSMAGTPISETHIFCTFHKTHIPILKGITCDDFEREGE